MIRGPYLRPPVFIKDLNRSNGNSNAARIVMDPDAPYPVAVLAQELVEWQYKFKRGAPVAAASIAALWTFGGEIDPLALTAFSACLAVVGLTSPRWVRHLHCQMELLGHMVEVIAAEKLYGSDAIAHFGREAKVLTRYDQFDDWEIDEIIAGMDAMEERAEAWVNANLDHLRSWLPLFHVEIKESQSA